MSFSYWFTTATGCSMIMAGWLPSFNGPFWAMVSIFMGGLTLTMMTLFDAAQHWLIQRGVLAEPLMLPSTFAIIALTAQALAVYAWHSGLWVVT